MNRHRLRPAGPTAKQGYRDTKLRLVDSQVLLALRTKPHTLYSLSRSNIDIFGRAIMSTGILHPHLMKLESMGFIRGYTKMHKRRYTRIYKVTNKGRAELGRQVKLFSRTLMKLKAV